MSPNIERMLAATRAAGVMFVAVFSARRQGAEARALSAATMPTVFKGWWRRRKTLRVLADLDEDQLRDIGLMREDKGHYRALDQAGDPPRLHEKI